MPTDNDQKSTSISGPEEISLSFTKDYRSFLLDLKDKIRNARFRSALAINQEVIDLYWHIGKQIIEKQNWGSKLIEEIEAELNELDNDSCLDKTDE